MSVKLFRRPPRIGLPPLPEGELQFDPPPRLPWRNPSTAGLAVDLSWILIGLAAAAATVLLFASRERTAFAWLALVLLAAAGAAIAVLVVRAGGSRPDPYEVRMYHRDLGRMRRECRRVAREQWLNYIARNPPSESLWSLVGTKRMWERRSADEDFGIARVGIGTVGLSLKLVAPRTAPIDELDPGTAQALRRLIGAHSTVSQMPISVDIRGRARIVLRGSRHAATALMRSMLCQLALFHSPDDLVIGVVTDRPGQWEWVKWLPHAVHPELDDAVGRRRLVVGDCHGLESLLAPLLLQRPRFQTSAVQLDGPHVVIVKDTEAADGSEPEDWRTGIEGLTIFDLGGIVPTDSGPELLCLDVAGDQLEAVTAGAKNAGIRPDRLSAAEAESLARQLSPYRLRHFGPGRAASSIAGAEYGAVHAIGDVRHLDVEVLRGPRPAAELLRVAVGVNIDGSPVTVDLKEAALGGHGPHGVVVGAAGAGKSELLRGMLLGLAARHSPEQFNVLGVEFGPTSTFRDFDELPHTVGVVSDFDSDSRLLPRLLDVLQGEILRRRELLGGYASVSAYEADRLAGLDAEPLSSLVIAIDEYDAVRQLDPAVADILLQIGRTGRSLGMHLLLSMRHFDPDDLGPLEPQLAYRIGLRTATQLDSRAALGIPDANELPRMPGHGYLKTGEGRFARFVAPDTTAPPPALFTPEPDSARWPVRPFGVDEVPADAVPRPEPAEPVTHTPESTFALVRDQLVRGGRARQLWTPPLGEPFDLSRIFTSIGASAETGLTAGYPEPLRPLHIPVGLEDRPFEQRRMPLLLPLDVVKGHVAIAGGPHSGKSTLMATIVTSLALTHTPRQVQVYGLDFGGGLLTTVSELPHVGSVAVRRDVDAIRPTVSEIRKLLASREESFFRHGLQSIVEYRSRRETEPAIDDGYGDVFLVIDGLTAFRTEYEDESRHVSTIIERGLNYGVHVIITVSSWSVLPEAQLSKLGTRLELRLEDPGSSVINTAAARRVPEGRPGLGLSPDALQFQVALPRFSGRDGDGFSTELTELAQRSRRAWQRDPVPSVRILPLDYPASQLPPAARPSAVGIGIGETDAAPVVVDFDVDSHLIAVGDSGSGKTNLLRHVARSICEQYPPETARLIVVDAGNELRGAYHPDHLLAHIEDLAHVHPVGDGLTVTTGNRTVELGRTATGEPVKLFVLIDDYQLIQPRTLRLLNTLFNEVWDSPDLELHFVVTQHSSGLLQIQDDPYLSPLSASGAPVVLMSCPGSEGRLFGRVTPRILPPGRALLVRHQAEPELVQLARAQRG